MSRPLTSHLYSSIDGDTPSLAEAVFSRLACQLGARLADLWAGTDPWLVRAEWAQALADMQPEEIERGLRSCQSRPFAPTLGEFCRLCRPCLDPEMAWVEAVLGMECRQRGQVGSWSHPAVFRAATRLRYEVRSRSYNECRKRWTWVLTEELTRGWGEPVEAPLPALQDSSSRRGPPSVRVRERIAVILKQPPPLEASLQAPAAVQGFNGRQGS